MREARPELPAGVILGPHGLEDINSATQYALNSSATQILALIDGKRTLAEISTILGQYYAQPEAQLLTDVTSLSAQLNSAYLLNLRWNWNTWLTLWQISLLYLQRPFIPWRRYQPPLTNSFGLLLLWMVGIITWALTPFMALPVLCLSVLPFVLPLGADMLVCLIGLHGLIFGSLILSYALHETAHLVATRWFLGACHGFVVRRWLDVSVVRPKLPVAQQDLIVSLIGPLTPGWIALACLLFLLYSQLWVCWIPMLIFGGQMLPLLSPSNDLRLAWSAWQRRKG